MKTRVFRILACGLILLGAAHGGWAQSAGTQSDPRFLDFSFFSPTWSSAAVSQTSVAPAAYPAWQTPNFGPTYCPTSYAPPAYGTEYYGQGSWGNTYQPYVTNYGYVPANYGAVWPRPRPWYVGYVPPGPPMVSVSVPTWPTPWPCYPPRPQVTVSTWQQPFYGYPAATVVSVTARDQE